MHKKHFDCSHTPYTETGFVWIVHLNMKGNTVTLLEENVGGHHDFG